MAITNTHMASADAPAMNLAECWITVEGKRYLMAMAKNFEAKANKNTAEIKTLGNRIIGHKSKNMDLPFSMTIYKVTEIFDEMIERYKNTGLETYFDIQVTSEDPSSSIGRSTKVYTDCIIDGEILLSAFDADGEFIEQTVEGYAHDFQRPEKYTNPAFMG